MSNESPSFVCETCGKEHSGLPTDRAFKLPDQVWSIAESERADRATWNSDLCQMGDDYFIRSFLPIPFKSRSGYFGWGVWVKVSWTVFQRYREIYDVDASDEPTADGELANALPYDLPTVVPVKLKFGKPSDRPQIFFPAEASHTLARELASGLTDARYHEILVSIGAA
jgi:hypothetical protein